MPTKRPNPIIPIIQTNTQVPKPHPSHLPIIPPPPSTPTPLILNNNPRPLLPKTAPRILITPTTHTPLATPTPRIPHLTLAPLRLHISIMIILRPRLALPPELPLAVHVLGSWRRARARRDGAARRHFDVVRCAVVRGRWRRRCGRGDGRGGRLDEDGDGLGSGNGEGFGRGHGDVGC